MHKQVGILPVSESSSTYYETCLGFKARLVLKPKLLSLSLDLLASALRPKFGPWPQP